MNRFSRRSVLVLVATGFVVLTVRPIIFVKSNRVKIKEAWIRKLIAKDSQSSNSFENLNDYENGLLLYGPYIIRNGDIDDH